MLRARSLLVVLCASCATAPKPGVTGEAPVEAGASTKAGGDEELSSAFTPSETPTAKPAVRVTPPPTPTDPRAPFRSSLAAAKKAVEGKQLSDAGPAVAQTVQMAAELGGDERAEAGALAFSLAFKKKDPAEAQRAALAWRAACGPENLDACRKKALSALTQVAALKGASAPKLKSLVADLEKLDACVWQAEKSARPPPCAGASEKIAQAQRDGVSLARFALAKAKAEPKPKKRAPLLERAEAKCAERPCASIRRRALGELSAIALTNRDFERAVKYRLREVQVLASGLPDEERSWTRTPELDAVCAQYDAVAGAGACRRVEKQQNGAWSFHDFSTEKSNDGLSRDQVRKVNEHYAVLLQECLAEQARRLSPPDEARYDVRWMVFNDGRVGEVHFTRPEHESGALAECLRTQFAVWRYPRYEGEWQHVEQSFSVKAAEHRSSR